MFKDFTAKMFTGSQKLRNKDAKQIFGQLEQNYPTIIDILKPMQEKQITLIKAPNRFQFLAIEGQLLFWSYYDGQYYPMLRLLHQYPSLLKIVQIDKGACKFLLQGAQLMAPGINFIDPSCKIQGIYPFTISQDVEAMGYIKLSQEPTNIMKPGRKDVAGEILMMIGDGLWEGGDNVKM